MTKTIAESSCIPLTKIVKLAYKRIPASVIVPTQQPIFSDFFRTAPTINYIAIMTQSNEIQMQLALEHCRKVDKPNFSAIARQFPPVNCQTLKHRFEGTQNSRA